MHRFSIRTTLLLLIITILQVLVFRAFAIGNVSFKGSSLKVLTETPDKSTGLNAIFVVYDTKGVEMTYHAKSGQPVKWYKYGAMGGGYAEEIESITVNGGDYTLAAPAEDCGYIIEDGSERYYFWVVNYITHRLWLRGLSPSEEQGCTSTTLDVEKEGSPIHYYTINGRMMTLDQAFELTFTTQEWDEQQGDFRTILVTRSFESVESQLRVTPPVYAKTTFVLEGDKFLRQWNWIQRVESGVVEPTAVQVHTLAEQVQTNNPDTPSNIIGASNDSGLGGSAPADITFYAFGTEGVIHHEWQLASDENFEYLQNRFNVQDLNYIFREQGTTYVRYIGSNASGDCEAYSETYTVFIGDSQLKCPNAFSPGASPGVNDEWKVSYRSIVDFECWIFNRYGEQVFHFSDPSLGWDGKHNGKLVGAGVYFYVIDAMGADGKHYKLNGDINIIKYRGGASSAKGEDPDPEPN